MAGRPTDRTECRNGRDYYCAAYGYFPSLRHRLPTAAMAQFSACYRRVAAMNIDFC